MIRASQHPDRAAHWGRVHIAGDRNPPLRQPAPVEVRGPGERGWLGRVVRGWFS